MSLAAIRMNRRSKSYERSKESRSKAAVSSALPQQECGSKVNVSSGKSSMDGFRGDVWVQRNFRWSVNIQRVISRKRTFQTTCGPVQLKRSVLQEKAGVVAKIIEVYIPKSFRKKGE